MKKLFGVLLATVILLSSLLLEVYAENIEYIDDSRIDIGEILGYTYKITFIDGESITEKEYYENETIIPPVLTASREYDIRWSQSETEYIAPHVTMPKEEITVYSFKSPVISFENYPSIDFVNNSVVKVSSDYAFTGEKSFKYDNVHSLNSLENSMALGKAVSGTSYKISFKYYVCENLRTAHYIVPYTGNLNLLDEGNNETGKRIEYTASQFNISSLTETGKWIDGQIYFTADKLAVGDFDNIYLQLCSNEVSLGDSIYFDDFSIEEMITADFILPDGFSVNSTNGTLSDRTFTAYYNKNTTITAPEVLTSDGVPVLWVDENGLGVTEFNANGIYIVKLDA